MRYIEKSSKEPKCLELFKKDSTKTPLLYSDLGKPYIQKYTEKEQKDKANSKLPTLDYKEDDLKDVLLKEQGFLCAYCLQRITKETMTIEHWYPRCLCKSIINDTDKESKCNCKKETSKYCSQIDYYNLIAVCEGITSVDDGYRHCDTLRGDFKCVEQKLSIYPCNKNQISKIVFSKTGKVIVNSKFPMTSEETEELKNDIENKLGLNQKHFIKNRQSILLGLKDSLDKKKMWKKAEYERIISRYSNFNKDGKLPPYNEYVLQYFRKKLNS